MGYVGTVTAACLARLGSEVIVAEPNSAKVEALNAGHSPIKEPGLDDLVRENVSSGKLCATDNGASMVPWADASLICVGTPSADDGSAVMDHVRNVAAEIGRGLRDAAGYHVVALRSTALPGTVRNVLLPILEEHSGRRVGSDFGLVSNPEFLRETTAISDFHAPPYTIIGELDADSGDVIESLLRDIEAPVHRVTLEEAELLKLANNAFHALKIAYANEIGRLCDRLELDSHSVMRLVCADTQLNISPAYLRPGFAFGGSCLPKDLRSLTFNARQLDVELPLLEAVLPSNQLQAKVALLKVRELGARRVAVLGLSFKPGTDDLRESPVIDLIRDLLQDGVDVLVHDPDVKLDEMLGSNQAYLKHQLPQINEILIPRLEDSLDNCQVVVVTQSRPAFVKALQAFKGGAVVLDLVRLSEDLPLEDVRDYRGISW